MANATDIAKVAPKPSQKPSNSSRERSFASEVLEKTTTMITKTYDYAKANKIISRLQLYGTAVLCIFDMATDIMMVAKYFEEKEYGFAKATLTCITLNLALQSLITYCLNMNKPWKKQVTEQLIVFSLVKQGVVAFRAEAKEAINIDETIADATAEMTITRITEMVTEAIPGTVIQVFAIMKLGMDSTLVISLVSSILCASFLSAVISYEYDMDDHNRDDKSNFYGFIPGRLRWKLACFVALASLSAFNLMIRSLGMCLIMMSMGSTFMLSMLIGEMLLFAAYKIVRQDHYYWVPAYGVVGFIAALLVPLLIKACTDWSAVMHFRGPPEIGGAYVIFTLGMTIVWGLLGASLYDSDELANSVIETNTVLKGTLWGSAGIVASMVLLLYSSETQYLETFWTLQTGKEYIREYFTLNTEDRLKIVMLSKNENMWRAVLGEEVKAWLKERLPVWIDEGPEWFDDEKKVLIQDWMVDDKALLIKLRSKEEGATIKSTEEL
ncbi:hypothetical protein TrVE_jg10000 [Triparma verrucosa]|uniref:Uncharacterized protein n=1 Tax=Triparma verrucosa TaxID=1606542 RepID=A0A9W7C5B4_9STRA|nr:hypothetical protein TrVE_jg10000 [Triparma verrucosa]